MKELRRSGKGEGVSFSCITRDKVKEGVGKKGIGRVYM